VPNLFKMLPRNRSTIALAAALAASPALAVQDLDDQEIAARALRAADKSRFAGDL
jgi:hypothetical protein